MSEGEGNIGQMPRTGDPYEMSVLPDHCVNRPRKAEMNSRRRIPAVRNMSNQDCFDSSSSILMVRSICASSALTMTELRSPSAWYFVRMSKASS